MNPTNGSIFLVSNAFESDNHNLHVSCSNGIDTTKCSVKFIIIKSTKINKPVWVYPNTQDPHECVNILEVFSIFFKKKKTNIIYL